MPADRRSKMSFVEHTFLNSPRKEGPHFRNNVAAGRHGKRAGVTPIVLCLRARVLAGTRSSLVSVATD